jgi:hypothetical protein
MEKRECQLAVASKEKGREARKQRQQSIVGNVHLRNTIATMTDTHSPDQ